jgi:hypothetical protein
MNQGLIPISGFKYTVGIAYIAIPQDLDRDKYIKDCYANHYVCMRTEDGGFHNRIPVSPEVLNFLEFPIKINELGSPVVYVTDQQLQHHYIVSRFQKRETLGDSSEHKFKFTRQLNGGHVEINGSAKNSSINVLIDGNNNAGICTINIFNKDKTSQLNVDIQGDVSIKSTGTLTLEQYGDLIVKTIDSDDNESSFKQSSSENKFYNEKFIINDGDEPMALGNKLVDFFEKLIDQIGAIQTITQLGLQPIVNKSKVLELKNELKTILSKEGFLKQ